MRGPLAENWTLAVLIPRTEIFWRERATGDTRNLQGLGDVSVFAEHGDGAWSWLVGLSLPTGDEAESPAPGVVPPSLLQLGTGTWDPMLGAAWNGADGEGFEPFVDALAIVPFDDSDAGLQVGRTWIARAGGQWLVDGYFRPGLQLEYLYREEDRLNSDPLANSGGALWTLVPSVQFPVHEQARVRIAWRLPVDQDLNGTQVGPGDGFVVEAGWIF